MGHQRLLELTNVTKRYPGVVALDHVHLTMNTGQVHALVGENGAGKSTLIKILAGVIRPDEGDIRIDDKSVHLPTPQASHKAGIGVVHQHTHLIPDLTIAENFALRQGYPRNALGLVGWSRIQREARTALQLLIPHMDVSRDARSLSGVEKQMVELAFGLAAAPRILILDEPTAVLPHAETELLFQRVRDYAAKGGSVLYVSHRLDEIFSLGNDVTVFRDGKFVWCKQISETSHEDLIQGMVGRAVSFQRDPESIPGTDIRLEVSSLSDSKSAFEDVSFKVKRGEIYGIYGLVGAGQSELSQALFGLRKTSNGSAKLGERDLRLKTPRQRVRSRMAYVPADRLSQGMFHQMSVGENMSISSLDTKTVAGLIRGSVEQIANEQKIQELRVKTLGVDQGALQLSGGNQQKVLLARWLQTQPELLILEEPTQGVDVGAKGEIHKIVTTLAKQGVSVLLVTSEIPELLALSHRVAVMREGRLVAELDAATTTDAELLRHALPDSESKTRAMESAESQGGGRSRSNFISWLTSRREAGLLLFLALFCAIVGATIPAFRTTRNIQEVLVDQSILTIGALGMMLVIIAGGIDISAGAILGLAAMTAGKLNLAGYSGATSILAALGVGLGLGLFNGTLTVLGRVHSIVITLGALFIFRPVMIDLMGGKWLFNLTPEITWLGRSNNLLIAALLAAVLVHLFLRHMPSGRRLYAFGGDGASAQFLGIYARKVIPLAFALSGMLMGFAGVLFAGRYATIQANTGQGFELKVIAAAVIGGTHIMGGRGSVLGTVLGALFLGLISNVLVLSHISTFWDNVVVGAMIVLAVWTDALASRRSGRSE